MNELLTPNHVLLDFEAHKPEDVFEAVAAAAQEDGVTDEAKGIYNGLVQRETEVTTGLMDGYAIPHTKTDAAKRAALYYVRSKNPLAWETMDDTDVTDMFVLIAPASDQNNTHLMMLSALATCLLEDEFKEAVRSAATADDVVAIVSDAIEKESE